MPTVFVSANDTGAGKTWVTATLARLLLAKGCSVHMVKPVETGVTPEEVGDARFVWQSAGGDLPGQTSLTVATPFTFTRPMAPVEAARFDGARLSFEPLVDAVRAEQTKADWTLVEGAGGLAVPLEDGPAPRDWWDFARAISADYTVLVVADRLGAINQARLLAHYVGSVGKRAGWWLNQADPDVTGTIRASNETTLSEINFPLWAVQDHQAPSPRRLSVDWLK